MATAVLQKTMMKARLQMTQMVFSLLATLAQSLQPSMTAHGQPEQLPQDLVPSPNDLPLNPVQAVPHMGDHTLKLKFRPHRDPLRRLTAMEIWALAHRHQVAQHAKPSSIISLARMDLGQSLALVLSGQRI